MLKLLTLRILLFYQVDRLPDVGRDVIICLKQLFIRNAFFCFFAIKSQLFKYDAIIVVLNGRKSV